MIVKLTSQHANQVAKLHKESLPDEFLSSLGKKFLTVLYSILLRQKSIVAYGYLIEDKLIGFIIGTTNKQQAFRQVIGSSQGLKLVPYLVFNLFKKPAIVFYFAETLFYSKVHLTQTNSELLAICVAKQYRRQGIGKKLVGKLQYALNQRGQRLFAVSTTSKVADSFYQKLGGRMSKQFTMFGKKWNMYLLKTKGN